MSFITCVYIGNYKYKMNLFILSLIQREIAQFMMDKHVSKILLEAVQMLCSTKRIIDPDDTATNDRIYKMAHKNQNKVSSKVDSLSFVVLHQF